MTMFISAPHSQLTPLSCTPACNTAQCPKPPPGFKLLPSAPCPSAPLPHNLTGALPKNILQASYAPLFSTAVSAATGSESDHAAHTTAGRGHDAFSLRGRWCARRREERHHIRGGSEGLDSRRTGLPVRLPHRLSRRPPPPPLGGLGDSREPATLRGPGGKGGTAPPPPAPPGSASQGRHYQAREAQHQC